MDGAGNVYVTGWSGGLGHGFDYATIKYGPNGNQLWVARYNGPDNSHDEAASLAVDGAGNVYVTGFSGFPRMDFDYATIKYGPTGASSGWPATTAPATCYDEAKSLAVDGAGNVYVTGSSDVSDTGSTTPPSSMGPTGASSGWPATTAPATA